ncbi:MAG: HesA/MoeB/ThiF family protein [Chloroflexota bacterium]
MLTDYDLKRYDRQMMVAGWGEAGQEKLKRAKVFIAGAGGLGCPLSIYLAVAGVGKIKLVDHDKSELSNLNRQILHWDEDVGRRKVDSAGEKLKRINPKLELETSGETITQENVERLVSGCDAIVDAMDNIATRYALNRAAQKLKLPLFHGAIYGFEGRAMTVLPGKTACLACLYHGETQKVKFPVVGVVPAIIACIEATEVIKYFVGIGELLTDRLLIYDGLSMKFMEFSVNRNPNCTVCCD